MGGRKCTFRKRDVQAAVKAVTAAGEKVARVELDANGKIIIVTSNEPPETETETKVIL